MIFAILSVDEIWVGERNFKMMLMTQTSYLKMLSSWAKAKAKENSDCSSFTNLWILARPKFAIPIQNNAYFKQGTKDRIMPTFQTVNDKREFLFIHCAYVY